MDDFNNKDKKVIAKSYIFPKILENFNMTSDDVYISDKTIEYLIANYVDKSEMGMRKIKQVLDDIVSKINVQNILDEGSRSKKILKDKKGRILITKKLIDTVLDNEG